MVTFDPVGSESEMSIAAEDLPLPRRDDNQGKLPRRCRDAPLKKFTATAPLPRRAIKKLAAAAPLPRWYF